MRDIKAYEGMTAEEKLNYFRNFHYTDGNVTENGIIADAVNEILPKYIQQKAEIERLKKLLHLAEETIDDIEDSLYRGTRNDWAMECIEEYMNKSENLKKREE